MQVTIRKVVENKESSKELSFQELRKQAEDIFPSINPEYQIIKRYCKEHKHFHYSLNPYIEANVLKRLSTATGQAVMHVKMANTSTPSGILPTYDGFNGYLLHKKPRVGKGSAVKFNNGSLPMFVAQATSVFAKKNMNVIKDVAKRVYGPLENNGTYDSFETKGVIRRQTKLKTLHIKGDKILVVRTYKPLNDAIRKAKTSGMQTMAEPNHQKFADMVNFRLAEMELKQQAKVIVTQAGLERERRAQEQREKKNRDRRARIISNSSNNLRSIKSNIVNGVGGLEKVVKTQSSSLNKVIREVEKNLRELPELTPIHGKLQNLQEALLILEDDLFRAKSNFRTA